jgi:acetyl-CoA carboxylase carboxyltransferase component
MAGRAPGSDGSGGRRPAGLRKELEAIADDTEREERVRQATAAARENAKALNAAQLFEFDDVIDPADTRALIAAKLTAAVNAPRSTRARFLDTR